MRRVGSKDTAPELAMRRILREMGLRYRLHCRDLAGRPDIVLSRSRVAIFVDGDLWHGGQWMRRGLASVEEQFHGENREYWVRKIRRNMLRDLRITTTLLNAGWRVLRLWESSIATSPVTMTEVMRRMIGNSANGTVVSRLPLLTFSEYFAGIGLMRMGLEAEGWTIAFANDIDPRKREMYGAHFADADEHFVLDDINALDHTSIPTTTLATASFPCTDLSLAGGRRGLDNGESSAFWGFARTLEAMGDRRPPLVLLENVPGFLTSHGGADFEKALNALNELGYAVDSFQIDASRFVPQSRQRLFVVGVRDGDIQRDDVMEDLLLEESELRPASLARFIRTHPDIRWRIRRLPDLPRRDRELRDIIENLPEDASEWWSDDRALYLLNQMSPRHRRLADQLIEEKRFTYGTVFRRMRKEKSMAELRVDGVAGCLRTPRGGSGRQIIVRMGKGSFRARLLTPREAARLMGADDFVIETTTNKALFGFGDAVCVPVISWIARYYLAPLITELIHDRPLVQEG